jgi:hypothetical protein
MLREVSTATALPNYRLVLTFDDGSFGEVDVSELIDFTGVFAPLRDPGEFEKVRVDPDSGTICWPNGADLDPQVLHSRATGQAISFPKPAFV